MIGKSFLNNFKGILYMSISIFRHLGNTFFSPPPKKLNWKLGSEKLCPIRISASLNDMLPSLSRPGQIAHLMPIKRIYSGAQNLCGAPSFLDMLILPCKKTLDLIFSLYNNEKVTINSIYYCEPQRTCSILIISKNLAQLIDYA